MRSILRFSKIWLIAFLSISVCISVFVLGAYGALMLAFFIGDYFHTIPPGVIALIIAVATGATAIALSELS